MNASFHAKILLLEDEQDLRDEVTDFFAHHGVEIQAVGSIKQFWQYFQTQAPDLVILDRMLPDGDGLTVLQELRRSGSRCGIVMLTAKDSAQDLQQGMENLADHYLSKPFPLLQLLAVVRALVWRIRPGDKNWLLQVRDWTLVDPNGQALSLTAQEFAFVRSLSENPHQVRSRQKLTADLGKSAEIYDVRNLDALVLRLRKKAQQSGMTALPIRTVHGAGYTFAANIDIEEVRVRP